ncbi:hypothetical protein Dsin_032013 [Dipteronia sinensis]|uniref:Reverse transcriptase domain-containing protein n=1 Tax=Dipteronia sinensis TaxID=43782 RepID=A0AAE0DSX6_9ROSI|nr:hypothetical protein Dsin_032013 [Dipteronia sinensis]
MAWNTPEIGVLGCMEFDMNNNHQIGVLQPGMITDFSDFPSRFRVHIMTKGYDMKPGTNNLWIMIGYIGKTTNTEKVLTKLDLAQNLMILTQKGIPFVTAPRISSERRQDLQLGSSEEQTTVKDPKLQRVIDYAHITLIFGSDPLKHWEKDKLLANINIIKPDLHIRTKEFPYTPEDVKEFDTQISELLQQHLISKSNAPHRSAAFMVRNHAEQIRGKARMVINYKRLNDNTYTDAYDIPTKELLMLRISNAKYFSKFDCKSGFWQVKLDSDSSIPWTTFSCSKGLFQWNVMPFGLKNAPGIFQRKMDGLFNRKPFLDFCLVYIDDILVFSDNRESHEKHLMQVITQFINHGLVINPKKMVLLQSRIEFLGLTISRGNVSLQPHISKSILDMPDKFQTVKELRSFLGKLNYARNFIPNLAREISSLHSKTSPKGNFTFNTEDVKTVRAIKDKVRLLKPLALPGPSDYIVVQTDGSKLGWGAILLAKDNIHSPVSNERICGYASGKYSQKDVRLTSLDYELIAVINALHKFRIHLFKPFTVRTDCQAIVELYNKQNERKISSRRWTNFLDCVAGSGYQATFEHIKGSNNTVADTLSRIIIDGNGGIEENYPSPIMLSYLQFLDSPHTDTSVIEEAKSFGHQDLTDFSQFLGYKMSLASYNNGNQRVMPCMPLDSYDLHESFDFV